jgi:hypothetical protein
MDKNFEPRLSWWHRWKLGAIQVKDAKFEHKQKKANAKQREKKQKQDNANNTRNRKIAERRAWLVKQRALIATISAIVVSVAVAIPAQALWFKATLVGEDTPIGLDPQSVIALAAPILIEGLCWLSAFLYADSVSQDKPVRVYRVTTFLFAATAAAINFAHGAGINPIVGVVFAIASLMGVGAWELYMHRTRHMATGMNADEIKLWAKRRLFDRKVYRQMQRLRRTFGAALPLESAWRMAYLRVHGSPTVPVPVPPRLLEEFRALEAAGSEEGSGSGSGTGSEDGSDGSRDGGEPGSEGGSREGSEPGSDAGSDGGSEEGSGTSALAVLERSGKGSALEVPVNWEQVTDVDALVSRYWPDLLGTADEDTTVVEAGTGTDREVQDVQVQQDQDGSGPQRQEPGKELVVRNPRNPEPVTEGTVPGLNEEEWELRNSEGATAALLRYFDRISSEGFDVEQVDRKELGNSLGCSTRNVSKAVAKWNKTRNHA